MVVRCSLFWCSVFVACLVFFLFFIGLLVVGVCCVLSVIWLSLLVARCLSLFGVCF